MSSKISEKKFSKFAETFISYGSYHANIMYSALMKK
jgi:hypothetical protein